MQPALITSVFYDQIPFERVIPMIREAGFKVVSIGANPRHSPYDTAAARAAIRQQLNAHGMTIDSFHAPSPECNRLFSLDEAERREAVRHVRIALEAASDLEGRIVVTHLLLPYDIPHGEIRNRGIDQGRRSIATLAATAAACGVQLALENGQRADYDEVLAMLLTEFDVPQIGFCYDSGHEHVQGTCFAILRRFGGRLSTLHLHDNTGADDHRLPYDGTIDWNEFRGILQGLPYTGNLLLEVHPPDPPCKTPGEFLALAWNCAQRLLKPACAEHQDKNR